MAASDVSAAAAGTCKFGLELRGCVDACKTVAAETGPGKRLVLYELSRLLTKTSTLFHPRTSGPVVASSSLLSQQPQHQEQPAVSEAKQEEEEEEDQAKPAPSCSNSKTFRPLKWRLADDGRVHGPIRQEWCEVAGRLIREGRLSRGKARGFMCVVCLFVSLGV